MITKQVAFAIGVSGRPLTAELPARWDICDTCAGTGRSSAYLGAFTGEQLAEDPDFAEEYFAGQYDRTCECCGGRGSVLHISEEACRSPRQRVVLRALAREAQYAAETAREIAAERRMGC